MPIRRNADAEAGDRLSNAYDKVRAAWESAPPIHEYSPSHAISNIWPALVLSYSGIEQSLKFLLARARDLSVSELIKLPAHESADPPKRTFKSHDLSWLFDQLHTDVRSAVEGDFRTFLSLYSYIPFGTLAEFLSEISGKGGEGYMRWRYTLVEFESKPPRNAPAAMLGAWRCLLLELKRQSEWKGSSSPGSDASMPLDEQLDAEFTHLLHEAESNELSAWTLHYDPNTGRASYPVIDAELGDWCAGFPNRLCAFASVLDRGRNHGDPGLTSGSEYFSTILKRWYGKVVTRAESDNTPVSMFARRAWGDEATSGGGPSVIWDEEQRLFRPTPWTLEFQTSTAAPQEGVVVADAQRYGGRLVALRRLARQHGYGFLENRSFPPAVPNSTWCRVYKVHEPDFIGGAVLALWQRRNDEDFFYACKSREFANAPVGFHWWYEQAVRLGAVRFKKPPITLD